MRYSLMMTMIISERYSNDEIKIIGLKKSKFWENQQKGEMQV
jgi:hypothetical protein